MTLEDILKGVKSDTFVFGFLSLLFLTLPGLLAIFFLDRELFLALDWIKLILLGAAFSTPLVFFNMILASNSLKLNGEDALFRSFTAGAMSTNLVFFGSLVLSVMLMGTAGPLEDGTSLLHWLANEFDLDLQITAYFTSFVILEVALIFMLQKDKMASKLRSIVRILFGRVN